MSLRLMGCRVSRVLGSGLGVLGLGFRLLELIWRRTSDAGFTGFIAFGCGGLVGLAQGYCGGCRRDAHF